MTLAGKRRHLADYELPTGRRGLWAQRIDGHVTLVDVPENQDERVYLVERHLTSLAELDGLCAAYIADFQDAGVPGVHALADRLERQSRAAA